METTMKIQKQSWRGAKQINLFLNRIFVEVVKKKSQDQIYFWEDLARTGGRSRKQKAEKAVQFPGKECHYSKFDARNKEKDLQWCRSHDLSEQELVWKRPTGTRMGQDQKGTTYYHFDKRVVPLFQKKSKSAPNHIFHPKILLYKQCAPIVVVAIMCSNYSHNCHNVLK